MRKIAAFLLALFYTTCCLADPILTGSIPNTFTPGTIISSSQMNANFAYIINGVNTNAAKNGVNSSITALTGLTTPITPAAGGSQLWTATSVSGTANAITVAATTPAISSFTLTNGVWLSIIPAFDNTGATTVNVNGLGAINVIKMSDIGSNNIIAGDLQVNNTALLYYNGTNFILINPNVASQALNNITAAATIDLGTITSHFANIQGNTTITSLGSSATTSNAYYRMRIQNGPVQFTFNATSLLTPTSQNIIANDNDILDVIYLGSGNWYIINWNRSIRPAGSAGVIQGLIVRNTGTANPDTIMNLNYLRAVLDSVAGADLIPSQNVGGAPVSCNSAVSGANGLDTGTVAANTFYYFWLIYNPSTNTVACLMSLSATAPTMPSGFTYRYRAATDKTDGSSRLLRIIQRGNRAQYEVVAGSSTPALPILVGNGASGSPTVPTFTTVGIGGSINTTTSAQGIFILTQNSTGNSTILAPNSSYGPTGSPTNPPPCSGSAAGVAIQCTFVLESSNVFYATSSVNASLSVLGWVDGTNAN